MAVVTGMKDVEATDTHLLLIRLVHPQALHMGGSMVEAMTDLRVRLVMSLTEVLPKTDTIDMRLQGDALQATRGEVAHDPEAIGDTDDLL